MALPSLGIHVHNECDAPTPHFGTVPGKYSISVISELFIESIRQPNPLPGRFIESMTQELPPFPGVQ
jgi:hypothetical protein